MSIAASNQEKTVKEVLFQVTTAEGKDLPIVLNTYEDGHQDLVLPYSGVEGVLGRAMEQLALKGLNVLTNTRESWPSATYYIVQPMPAPVGRALEPKSAEGKVPSSVRMVRTGRKVPFLELHIGELFFYEDAFWTRSDTYAGTDIRPRGRKLAPPPYGTTWGGCSFGVADETLLVEEVELVFETSL